MILFIGCFQHQQAIIFRADVVRTVLLLLVEEYLKNDVIEKRAKWCRASSICSNLDHWRFVLYSPLIKLLRELKEICFFFSLFSSSLENKNLMRSMERLKQCSLYDILSFFLQTFHRYLKQNIRLRNSSARKLSLISTF